MSSPEELHHCNNNNQCPISHACRTITTSQTYAAEPLPSRLILILLQGCTCHHPVQFRPLNAPACITYVLSCPSCASLSTLLYSPGNPRCLDATPPMSLLVMSCVVVLADELAGWLAEEHVIDTGMPAYHDTTATSPHYVYLCHYMYIHVPVPSRRRR